MEKAIIVGISVLGSALIIIAAVFAATKNNREVAVKALDCMSRQPEIASTFQINMLIAMGLVESIPIIAAVIAIVLVMANPF